MIRSLLFSVAPFATLGACTPVSAATPPTASYLAAILVADASSEPLRAASLPSQPLRRAGTSFVRDISERTLPKARLETGKRAETVEPRDGMQEGAAEVYPWSDGGLYRLFTSPGKVSDVVLQPGESLVSVAAGDTSRWVIGETTSGTGAEHRTHVLVKPSASGLATNLLIATDRRVYHLELESAVATSMTSISWTYPDDGLLALRGGTPALQPTVAVGVAVETLNFNYRIEGDRPSWRPVRAFDDGRQVFIEFPPTLGQGEAPPLFVLGESGRAELVNYRIRGRYYVVDRLFAAAELRLGAHRQQVVRIVREGRTAS